MIRLNGKPHDISSGGPARPARPFRLLDLLAAQGIAPDARGVAVARNGTVVPRARWPETPLEDGDDIEIVKIMQGG